MDTELARSLLEKMLLIRIAEEEIARRYGEQQMRCPVHLCIGQEAVASGICEALDPQDTAFSTHRSHGHYLAKGGDLTKFIAELYGRSIGCSHGRGGSMHLIDLDVNFQAATPIVAGSIPLAVGAAFAFSLRKEPRISVAFFGDAAVEEGTFHEAANYAALKRLPVLFVCENNSYSVNTPLGLRQPKRPLTQLAAGHGIATMSADGNDVEAAFDLGTKARAKILAGQGPIFLEFPTYRWKEHCGHEDDHPKGLRPSIEVEEWVGKCPIVRFEERIVRANLMTVSEIATLRSDVLKQVQIAFEKSIAARYPTAEELAGGVYAD